MWDFIWLATIFSINLKTKFIPDTGLKLLNSFRSSEGFLCGAILKVSWNFPSANERFMIIVIGHGSRSHDLLGDDRIGFDTSLSEICEKVSKVFGAVGGVGSRWMFESGFADSRVILAILLKKKLLKELASLVLHELSGRLFFFYAQCISFCRIIF